MHIIFFLFDSFFLIFYLNSLKFWWVQQEGTNYLLYLFVLSWFPVIFTIEVWKWIFFLYDYYIVYFWIFCFFLEAYFEFVWMNQDLNLNLFCRQKYLLNEAMPYLCCFVYLISFVLLSFIFIFIFLCGLLYEYFINITNLARNTASAMAYICVCVVLLYFTHKKNVTIKCQKVSIVCVWSHSSFHLLIPLFVSSLLHILLLLHNHNQK